MTDAPRHAFFVSYWKGDRELVAAVARRLDTLGVSVWYDAEIDSGSGWRETIAAELERSDMLAIFFSAACNPSRQLQKELAAADSRGKPVVPILTENTRPRGAYLFELAHRKWIDASPDPMSHVEALVSHLAALAGKSPSGAAAADPPAPAASGSRVTRPAQAADYVSRFRPGHIGRMRLIASLALMAFSAILVLATTVFAEGEASASPLVIGLAWAGLSLMGVTLYGVVANRRAIAAFRSNLKKL